IEPFDVPFDWQDTLSIDPGLNNPLSCHWYAQDFDGNVYVVAEHYEAKRDVVYHAAKIKEISRRLNWKTDKKGNIEALMDSAALQRTLNGVKSVAELFCEQGISVNASVDKSMYAGINRVKALLKSADGKTKLYVFNSCVNMIREFKGYFWGGGDSPVKRDDHAMDELRYYVSNLQANKAKPLKTWVQQDKEKLYRSLKRGVL
ncbi:MAG: hypothetical protein OSJ68_03870, partial [Clostridia bacterium]|nr:hypothetical protein [Clostridia bacterium]